MTAVCGKDQGGIPDVAKLRFLDLFKKTRRYAPWRAQKENAVGTTEEQQRNLYKCECGGRTQPTENKDGYTKEEKRRRK